MAPPAKLNASFAARNATPGDLALISQSGAIAAGLLEWAARRRVGFSGARVARRHGRRRFRRLPRLFRADPRHPRDPALRRVDHRRPQVHVGGPRRGAHQAGRRDQVGPARAGRAGGRDAHRRARRLGRRLRRRLPPRRPAARVRPRRAVRRGRDARAAEALSGQASRHPDQRRRRRRARGRPADRPRRHACGAVAGHASPRLDRALPPTWSRANPVDIVGDADAARYGAALESAPRRRRRTTPCW